MNLDQILSDNIEYIFLITLIVTSFSVYYSRISIRFKLLFLSVMAMQGVALILLPNKKSDITGYLVFLSAVFLIFSLRKAILIDKNLGQSNILNYYIGRNFFNRNSFTLIGTSIISMSIIINIYSKNDQYGVADNLLILAGLSWIFYYNIPKLSQFLKDYTLIFLNLCPILLFTPILLIYIFSSKDFYAANSSWDSFLISKLLAIPLSKIISLLGIYSHSNGVYVSFELSSGKLGTVHIAQTCTGYYSTMIFISSFITYFIVDKRNFSFLFFIVVSIGILSAYLSNLLRMTIVVLAGHYYGMDALYWTHLNVGWIIFILFILIFWHYALIIFESDYKNTPQG